VGQELKDITGVAGLGFVFTAFPKRHLRQSPAFHFRRYEDTIAPDCLAYEAVAVL
jgi:hypothetical protein